LCSAAQLLEDLFYINCHFVFASLVSRQAVQDHLEILGIRQLEVVLTPDWEAGLIFGFVYWLGLALEQYIFGSLA
jgi:hypothetical protein